MPLFGQNPRRFGRNGDIDLPRMSEVEYPFHAVIRLSKHSIEIRNKAAACHASQGGGRIRPGSFRIMRIMERLSGQRDLYMRAYPPVQDHRHETDLFEGIT
jgi:hypothetical protein